MSVAFISLFLVMVTIRTEELDKPLSQFYSAPEFFKKSVPITPIIEGNSDKRQFKQKYYDELFANYKSSKKIKINTDTESLVEGDLLLTKINHIMINGKPILSKGSRFGLWPDGVVTYIISDDITGYTKTVILKAMEAWSVQTCIVFKKKELNDKDYIEFMDGGGCFSDLGKVGGRQVISIGERCVRVGIVVHEIGHALGFYHEHSRPDRDSFVAIKMENVKDDSRDNFNKYSWDYIDTHGLPYDFGSIMHYRSTAFSRNGKPTIVSVTPGSTEEMGQRIQLSSYDIELARSMYQCRADYDEGGTVEPIKSCEDTTSMCSSWANDGMCTSGNFVIFMSKNCRVSCGVCTPSPETSPFKTVLPTSTIELKVTKTGSNTIKVRVEIDLVELARHYGPTNMIFIHLMYKPSSERVWYHGMYRLYLIESPQYTIRNLQPGTLYDITIRYSLNNGYTWSDFLSEVTAKTRKQRRQQ